MSNHKDCAWQADLENVEKRCNISHPIGIL